MVSIEAEQDSTQLEHEAARLVGTNVDLPTDIDRLIQIIRHYRWSQILRRFVDMTFRRLTQHRNIGPIETPAEIEPSQNESLTRVATIALAGFRNHLQHSQSDLPNGRLVLLNTALNLGCPLDWFNESLAEMPRLWQFQLQYHEYLLAHVADSIKPNESIASADWQPVWQTISSWLENHQPAQLRRSNDAWHPYCISRRIPVWFWILSIGNPGHELLKAASKSLYQQTDYLCNNLERGLGGNHLLENLTALSMAAVFFGDMARTKIWVETAERNLRIQLPQQVLSSGEHYERSPMYHCQILRNLLQVAVAAKTTYPSLASLCTGYAMRMLPFLEAILHPDGEIPLFGDSGFGEAPSVQEIRSLAALDEFSETTAETRQASPGNYWIWRDQGSHGDCLILDAEEVGAADLPAHAHCDLVTFEGSVGGRRWFVDSGNFNYENDSMRQYCRSSMAHNVATVSGHNSCQVWSRFRMGRRGELNRFMTGIEGVTSWAFASHNGYRRDGVRNMSRLVAVSPHFWLIADTADVESGKKLVGYLHLAPDIQLQTTGGTEIFSLDDGLNQRHISFFGVEHVDVLEGWYCKAFGFREKNSVLVYQCLASDVPFGWILSPEPDGPKVDCVKSHLNLRLRGSTAQDFAWRFDDFGPQNKDILNTKARKP